MIVPGKNETLKQYRTFPNRCKFYKIRYVINVAFQIRGESMGYSINGVGTANIQGEKYETGTIPQILYQRFKCKK